MIVGSGLLAKAFSRYYLSSQSIWIYAAGVSNSRCNDYREFARERLRLAEALASGTSASTFVYFSSCSIIDPLARDSAYVRHKILMEELVSNHPSFVVVRLPQIAGRTPNPHTLLNYLYARVSRSERFTVWANATRNIIDVDDVASIVKHIIENSAERQIVINVANPNSCKILELVVEMEKITGKCAITDIVPNGSSYVIDISKTRSIIDRLKLKFDHEYISRVIHKYYGVGAWYEH